MPLKSLTDYSPELAACVRCGACQATCPVYRESGQESDVARGKVELAAELLAGRLELDAASKKAFSSCLLCGTCSRSCPNQTPTAAIVAAARRDITAQQGAGAVGRGVAALTGHPRLVRRWYGSARHLAPLFLRKIPASSGLHLRFGSPNLQKRLVPSLPAHTLFDLVPEQLDGDPGKPCLGFFAGCSFSYLDPESGAAVVRVLRRLGHTVLTPRTQCCCGMPAISSGQGALATELATVNATAFAGTDAVITACASCGGMISHFYPEMQDSAAETLPAKCVDFHVFLKQAGHLETFARLPRTRNSIRVCWHDPCHLKNRGTVAEPRELLRALPNVDFVDQKGAALCCGLAGTFAVSQAALSGRIATRKAEALSTVRADLVATGCPGCLLQLAQIIHDHALPLQAVHSADLVLSALDRASLS